MKIDFFVAKYGIIEYVIKEDEKLSPEQKQDLFMTFLQLKKIFKEKLQGKYVLFGNPDDPASTNTYWMRMNDIEGANIVGGHEKDDTTVARKLEMVMQKIQSKSFTVYSEEVAVREAVEKNQEKKSLEPDAVETVYDGTDVKESPVAPALNEIDDHQQSKDSDTLPDDQEIDFKDFVIEETDDDQEQSAGNDAQSAVHQAIAAEDIFDSFDTGDEQNGQERHKKAAESEGLQSNDEDLPVGEDKQVEEKKKQQEKRSRRLMSGLQKKGVHVGEVNPNFHATAPTRKKQEEQKRKQEEEKQKIEEEKRQKQQEKGRKEEEERTLRQEEKQKEQEARELAEQEERERTRQISAQKEQEKIEDEERKAQQEAKEKEIQQRKEEDVRTKETEKSVTLNETNGVEDIFDSFTSDRGHSQIKSIERSEPPIEVQSDAKVQKVQTSQSIPVVPTPKLEGNLHVEGNAVVGEVPLLEAIDLFWKNPHHAKTTNTRDFIIDVEKFSDQYFSHFSDEKMRIMYGWQTLRESASESFHVSPTFSECESKFGPKALNQYIHSLPNR